MGLGQEAYPSSHKNYISSTVFLLISTNFPQEVYRVTFSPTNEGQLTSSGVGHIMFWKMANTFTGLKLQVLENCLARVYNNREKLANLVTSNCQILLDMWNFLMEK